MGLRRLADLAARVSDADWPVRAVRKAVDVLRLGEQANCQPLSFPWLEGLLEQAAQQRHDGEVLLYAQGLVPVGAAEELLGEAAASYQALRARQDVLETACRLRDEAMAQLPAYLPYLEQHPWLDAPWMGAVQALQELEALLTPPVEDARLPAAVLNSKIDEIRHQSALLQSAVDQLLQPFAPDSCDDLLRRGKRARSQCCRLSGIGSAAPGSFASRANAGQRLADGPRFGPSIAGAKFCPGGGRGKYRSLRTGQA